MKKYIKLLAMSYIAVLITACGGGGNSGGSDVVEQPSPVTINFPTDDGQNLLTPGESIAFTVSLKGMQKTQSSGLGGNSVSNMPVVLSLNGAQDGAYRFNESSFVLTTSNSSKVVTLTIESSAEPSQFNNTQLVANVNGYQSTTPVQITVVKAGTIAFNTNNLALSAESNANVVLKIAGNVGFYDVVTLTPQAGISLNETSCIFTPTVQTCPLTVVSSATLGDFQVTAKSATNLIISPLNVTVHARNGIQFGQSDAYLVTSGNGTADTTVVSLFGGGLSKGVTVQFSVSPSSGLLLSAKECNLSVGDSSCELELTSTSKESGNFVVLASASGYSTQRLLVRVDSPGIIHFEPSSLDMFANESYQAKLVFVPGSATVYNIPITLSSTDSNVTVDGHGQTPNLCTINSAVGDGTSCVITVTGLASTAAEITATEQASTNIDAMVVVVRKFIKTALLGLSATNCALDDKGQAYCWGQGTVGQIGNGDFRNVNVPTRVAQGELVFSSLLGASQNFCALTTDGQAYCWGAGTSGQVGNGAYVNVSVPTAVEQGSIKFSSLYASSKGNTICGLTSSGQAYCWGAGANGQLGNGSSTDKSATPSEVKQNGLVFTSLVMNASTNCGLTNDGAAACWGLNRNGQVGNENTLCGGPVDDCIEQIPVVVTMPANVTFKALSAMSLSFCALDSVGKTYCWGKGSSGQMGNSYNSISNKKPVAVVQNNGILFTSLVSLSDTSCGLTSSGQAYCWGIGTSGVIGGGTESSTNSTPVAVLQNNASYTKIFANQSADTVCANTVSGQIYCWGVGTSGQLGNGALQNVSSPVAVQQAVGLQFASLMLNGTNTCGLSTIGSVYCWGLGTNGQIGNGISGLGYTVSTPVAVVQPNATPPILNISQLLQTYVVAN